MDTKKISIIIPIYNAQLYIEETIKSLINQTFKNIEIILVNDGSTDNTKRICKKYANQDERIIIINRENEGQAYARNAGMKIAKGDYIMFLDSDDLFELDSCEYMYNIIENTKADYVIGNYQMMDADGTKWDKPAFDTEKYHQIKLDKNDFKKSFFVMNSTTWNKIYRKEFLDKNEIKFEKMSPSEDDYFTSLCYIKATLGIYTPKVMYWYRNSPNSLSKSCSVNYFKGINYAYKVIYDTFKSNNEINYNRYVYAKKNAYLLCQLIDSDQISDEEKIECIKNLEWYFKLSDELKVHIIHESLKPVMELIKEKKYDNVIEEINKLKKVRNQIPDSIRKRMSFPNLQDYEKMQKYDSEFKIKEKR